MKRITSPGGETVDVIPDETFAKRAGLTVHGLRSWQQARRPILGALWLHGPYEERSGRATALLHADAIALGYEGKPTAISSVLNTAGPAIARELRGKRLFRVGLGEALPQMWADKLTGDEELALLARTRALPEEQQEEPSLNGHEPAASEETETPRPEETPVPEGPSWDLEVTNAVALSLLTQVIEIVSTGGSDTATTRLRVERDEARSRLHQQTEYVEKLRRQIRETGDELAALKHERDGLRTRLRLSEENLRKATSPDVQRQVDALVREQLDKVMRAAPAGSKGA